MRPMTEKIPKSILSIKNRPFIDYQLSLFSSNGISDVLICVGHLGEMIESFVGDGAKWGIHVDYSWEKENLLGTAGALRNAADKLEDNFILTWGDSYVPLDYKLFFQQHLKSKYICNIGVFQNYNKWDKSNILFLNGLVAKYDKNHLSNDMNYIDVGISGISKKILNSIPAGFVSLDDVWQKLSIQNMIGGIEVKQRFYEIGSFDGFNEFTELADTL
jgi:NDP-sugar pyrophosphorylase family protein